MIPYLVLLVFFVVLVILHHISEWLRYRPVIDRPSRRERRRGLVNMQLYCRNCRFWVPVPPWQGNCRIRTWRKPRWSASARAGLCTSYTPKPATVYSPSDPAPRP